MLPKTLNHLMGKISLISKLDLMISPGAQQHANMSSQFQKAYKKKPGKFNDITAFAKESSKRSCHADDSAENAPDGNAIDEDNDLNKELVDIFSSDEDVSNH
jgi:hypothetical protein